MKKAALALGILAASTSAAWAQSTVQLYGIMDVGLRATTNAAVGSSKKTVVPGGMSQSRLGINVTEDLGGGLKATFNLEHGFASDTGAIQSFESGATPFWSRQANVELSGSFGAVRLGKWFPDSYFATADYVSMHNHDTGTSADNLYGTKFRTNNKVAYFTPNVSGNYVWGLVVNDGKIDSAGC